MQTANLIFGSTLELRIMDFLGCVSNLCQACVHQSFRRNVFLDVAKTSCTVSWEICFYNRHLQVINYNNLDDCQSGAVHMRAGKSSSLYTIL